MPPVICNYESLALPTEPRRHVPEITKPFFLFAEYVSCKSAILPNNVIPLTVKRVKFTGLLSWLCVSFLVFQKKIGKAFNGVIPSIAHVVTDGLKHFFMLPLMPGSQPFP